ncbi:hypothetical protein A9285_13710 [Listeria monocytogenes]|uniref:hypothetical protein n=1 Tax=Listeria monocytogenes TaxID=1639 RepID=UPI0004D9D59B|nr:hypothetical protein [Listeria monocytogenes]EAC2976643.1 hypothetical protein [Listeria monocytogenes]EAD7838338.1 hypothetical protein [Listeria monocytogenes]EAE2722964.1 hypothetical protein [Listeria monocytogenes]EAE2738724.1 hypothetical protein [Listeria monocytogenes]EAE7988137.1 hypothetical protein [Listeria monocytogenes]
MDIYEQHPKWAFNELMACMNIILVPAKYNVLTCQKGSLRILHKASGEVADIFYTKLHYHPFLPEVLRSSLERVYHSWEKETREIIEERGHTLILRSHFRLFLQGRARKEDSFQSFGEALYQGFPLYKRQLLLLEETLQQKIKETKKYNHLTADQLYDKKQNENLKWLYGADTSLNGRLGGAELPENLVEDEQMFVEDFLMALPSRRIFHLSDLAWKMVMEEELIQRYFYSSGRPKVVFPLMKYLKTQQHQGKVLEQQHDQTDITYLKL